MENEDFLKNIKRQLPPIPFLNERTIVFVASFNELNKQIVTEQMAKGLSQNNIKIDVFKVQLKLKGYWEIEDVSKI